MLNWPNLPIFAELKAVIINFYEANEPSVDVDNLSKPILDAMQSIVYEDDRQIIQAEIAHSRIGAAYHVLGVRPIILAAIQAGKPFVYVRLEDPLNPFPLPK